MNRIVILGIVAVVAVLAWGTAASLMCICGYLISIGINRLPTAVRKR